MNISFLRYLAAVWLCFMFIAPSLGCAWEITLSGEYENRIRWFSRTGPYDLFGDASLQDTAPGARLVGFAGTAVHNLGALPTVPAPTSNFFFNLGSMTGRQMLVTRGGFSSGGSSAEYNDSRLTLTAGIRLHKAARLGIVANIGGYRNTYSRNAALGDQGQGIPPLERYYVSQASTNAYETLGLVSIEQFWARMRLPLGTLIMGARAFPFGTGASLGHNTRSEMYLLAVPYGPFRFMAGIWPASMRIPSIWSNVPDSDLKNTSKQGLFLTYNSGSAGLGAGAVYSQYHGNSTVPYLSDVDESTLINIAFFKYANGVFFANTEYAWMSQDRYLSVMTGQPGRERGTQSQTVFIETYHFFAEAGLLYGPLKLTFMSAIASGPVLNNGNRLRNVPAGGFFQGPDTPAPFEPGPNPKIYAAWPINYQAMAPYEFLMFNTYAGGNNGGWNALDFTFVADEHGLMSDAYCFAARLDYALAANLNIWAAYIWAHRLERAGVYFGQYQSSGSLASGSTANLELFYTDAGRQWDVGADYVSNGFIGWEANLGVDWKLLEGVTWSGRYSYWQPGDYFREAYQAVALDRNGALSTAAVLRNRNAIHAFQSTFTFTF